MRSSSVTNQKPILVGDLFIVCVGSHIQNLLILNRQNAEYFMSVSQIYNEPNLNEL